MKAKLMIARFPGSGTEHSGCVDWLMQTTLDATHHPNIGEVVHLRLTDTPITMTRNKCLLEAERLGIDLVLMVDSDNYPDYLLGHDPKARPFFPTALEFMLNHPGPSIVGAPYCGPPPVENVYVFRWRKRETDHPNPDVELSQFTREEAAQLEGIQEVAALPTGVMLIDMRGVRKMPHPRFRYEWKDKTESEKSTTEDVYFSRNAQIAGIRQYCHWSAWAGHIKTKIVSKPSLLTPDLVAEQMREACLNRHKIGFEKIIQVGGGKPPSFPRDPNPDASEIRKAAAERQVKTDHVVRATNSEGI